jgi:hypothetical protein
VSDEWIEDLDGSRYRFTVNEVRADGCETCAAGHCVQKIIEFPSEGSGQVIVHNPEMD